MEVVDVSVDISRLYQLLDLLCCMLLLRQRLKLGLEGLLQKLTMIPMVALPIL